MHEVTRRPGVLGVVLCCGRRAREGRTHHLLEASWKAGKSYSCVQKARTQALEARHAQCAALQLMTSGRTDLPCIGRLRCSGRHHGLHGAFTALRHRCSTLAKPSLSPLQDCPRLQPQATASGRSAQPCALKLGAQLQDVFAANATALCSADVGGVGSLRSRPPSEKPCTEPTARTGSACAARYEPCFACRFAACYMTHQVVHLKLHCSCCGKTIPPDKQNQRHHVKCTGPGSKAFKRTADHADHENSMTDVDARTPTE